MATQAQTLTANRGGKRAKKMKNHTAQRDTTITVKEDDGQEYGKIDRVLGNCRFSVACFDGRTRIAKLRGRLTKGQNKRDNLIDQGDYVLLSTRDFDVNKCDIILKYTDSQVRALIKSNELPETATVVKRIGDDETEEHGGFDFETI